LKWEKVANRKWQAVGNVGSFIIEQSGTLFWARYLSRSGCKTFKLQPKQKLKDAKAQCEQNHYWESKA
jgi:hypothetical protein